MSKAKGSEGRRQAERQAKAKAKADAELAELENGTEESRLLARTDVIHDSEELAERAASGEFG